MKEKKEITQLTPKQRADIERHFHEWEKLFHERHMKPFDLYKMALNKGIETGQEICRALMQSSRKASV